MEETKVIPPNPEFIGVGCRGKWRSFSAVLTVNTKKTRIQGNSVTRPLAVSLPRPLTKRVKGLEDQMSKIKLKNIGENLTHIISKLHQSALYFTVHFCGVLGALNPIKFRL